MNETCFSIEPKSLVELAIISRKVADEFKEKFTKLSRGLSSTGGSQNRRPPSMEANGVNGGYSQSIIIKVNLSSFRRAPPLSEKAGSIGAAKSC